MRDTKLLFKFVSTFTEIRHFSTWSFNWVMTNLIKRFLICIEDIWLKNEFIRVESYSAWANIACLATHLCTMDSK